MIWRAVRTKRKKAKSWEVRKEKKRILQGEIRIYEVEIGCFYSISTLVGLMPHPVYIYIYIYKFFFSFFVSSKREKVNILKWIDPQRDLYF